MYNSGDELGAIVCDIGNYAARLGYAGEDFPKAYMPSVSTLILYKYRIKTVLYSFFLNVLLLVYWCLKFQRCYRYRIITLQHS